MSSSPICTPISTRISPFFPNDLLPISIYADCTCEDSGNADENNKAQALKLKLIVVASILVAGAFGVCVPLLENPCLGDKAWGDFPLANFVAILAAVVVMMVEAAATNWFNRSDNNKNEANHIGDEEKHEDSGSSEGFVRHRIISQEKFKYRTIATMSIFFTLTTPIGIALGFGISNIYDENSRTALIVQGVLNAVCALILIYMALVDLHAMDFMKVKVQTSTKCQILAFISILLGVGCMSLLAIWACLYLFLVI
ncbi:hypothetical protein L1887_13632 [Cichorium endivia]|nr:hypothetical protein L1887_13632 [Cichorium endivia]